MHRVGGYHQKISAACFQAFGSLTKDLRRTFPIAFVLTLFDVVEIDRVQQDPRRVKASGLLAHGFVHKAIVERCRFPAHAAKKADQLHAFTPARWVNMETTSS